MSPYRLTVRDSGRKIIDILSRNPKKDPDGYEEDDIAHMRKVVSYCKVRDVLKPEIYSTAQSLWLSGMYTSRSRK